MFDGDRLTAAWQGRAAVRERLQAEDTDCYRLFHGGTEGHPGLTADAYGSLLLIQCHRETFNAIVFQTIWKAARTAGFTGVVVWQRGGNASQVIFQAGDLEPRWAREFGLEYRVEALPRRLDPQLFLDTRSVRRRILDHGAASALNLFCYSGSLGVAAQRAGAKEVWQVDFSKSALGLARLNAERNGYASQKYVCEEIYPVLWQLAGRQVKRRKTGLTTPRTYVRLEARKFDLILLDPPQRSKGHFGAVDIKNDYAGLFRPCLEILAEGGTMVVTNNLAQVSLEEFHEQLERCSKKYARPWKSSEVVLPEEDFPSPDGRPPLKMMWLSF